MPIYKAEILRMQQEGVIDGQIRIGTSTPGEKKGSKKPVRLDTWRFTSPSRRAIEAAAKKFGGTAEVWESDRGLQWQTTTPLAELPVYFGGGATVDQWMVHWEKGKCLRRCTGAANAINEVTGKPCECNATGRELCQPETKLRVRFPDLPGVGWWRFTSHGKHVAADFPEKAAFLKFLAEGGIYVPANLILRTMILPGKRFPVVHIDIVNSMTEIEARVEGVGTLREIAAARGKALALTAGEDVAALPVGAGASAPPAGPAEQATPAPNGAREPGMRTQPGPQVDPGERARQAAEWARRDTTTREKIISFLADHAKDAAMDEFVVLDENEPAITLRELLSDRLEALAKAADQGSESLAAEPTEGDYDPELGRTIPPGVGVQPGEFPGH